MNSNRHQHSWIFALLIATLLGVATAARAQVRVGGWATSANGRPLPSEKYWGPCPVNLKFGWGILGKEPATVVYTTSRSDGVRSSRPLTLNLPAANRSMDAYVDWAVGANQPQFADFSGWVQLDITSPNPASQRIPFTIHCGANAGAGFDTAGGHGTVHTGRELKTTMEANGQMTNHVYTGPCPVTLKLGWEVAGTEPTRVIYWFDRSDGKEFHTPSTIQLPTTGEPRTIYTEWRVGANTPEFASYNGWIRLNIESPNPDSLENNFLLRCGK
jgi:hypothetical protein